MAAVCVEIEVVGAINKAAVSEAVPVQVGEMVGLEAGIAEEDEVDGCLHVSASSCSKLIGPGLFAGPGLIAAS